MWVSDSGGKYKLIILRNSQYSDLALLGRLILGEVS